MRGSRNRCRVTFGHHRRTMSEMGRTVDAPTVATMSGTADCGQRSVLYSLGHCSEVSFVKETGGEQVRSAKKENGRHAMAMATATGTLPEAEHSDSCASSDRINGRHGDRVVRFPSLRHGGGTGLRQALLPNEAPLAGMLACSDVFIGFVGRRIGAAIFGDYG